MKIGIITIHNTSNYGACYQAYALNKYICDLGYDCEIIDWHSGYQKDYSKSKMFQCARVKPVKYPIIKYLKSLFSRKSSRYNPENEHKYYEFYTLYKKSKHYPCIDELYSAEAPKYDLYITGSDQVWNPTLKLCLEPFFLTFAPKNARRISYAPSIGIDTLRENEKAKYREWLSSYESISLREQYGVDIVKEITKRADVYRVLDPVFLLSKEQWKSISKCVENDGEYMLLFMLNFDRNMYEYCKNECKVLGIRLIVVLQNLTNDVRKLCPELFVPGPQELLALINNSTVVVTHSFHVTVLSIIFEVGKLYSYIPKGNKRGGRIIELFRLLGIEKRLLSVDAEENYIVKDYSSVIDYSKVNVKLSSAIDDSKRWLNNAIIGMK